MGAYCKYCGKRMSDLGDSWFCKNTDCIGNTPIPKKRGWKKDVIKRSENRSGK